MYSPINPTIYCAVFAGALAGMAVGGRRLNSADAARYESASQVAGAFAQEFDTLYNNSTVNVLNILELECATQGFWSERYPNLVNSSIDLTDPSEYESQCEALIAQLTAANDYFSGQGITPPPFGGSPSGTFWTILTPISASKASPQLVQATATSDIAPQNMRISAQSAFLGATVHTTGGNLTISAGASQGGIGTLGGSIFFCVDGGITPSMTLSGNGNFSAEESIAAPQIIVVNAAHGRTPAILADINTPPDGGAQPGSLTLSNTWNPLWVQNQSSIWAPIPIIDFSTGQITFDPNSTAAGINQAQAITGPGNVFRIISQPSQTTSGNLGGDMSFILGANDPGGEYPANPRYFWFGMQTALGGHEDSTNYTNLATLAWNSGGAVIFNLGRGNNGVGGGVAGNEISGFAELGMATENHSPINAIVAGTGPTSTFLEITDTDNADDAAWSLAYFANHPTGGDVAGIQILYTETAIGTGTARYIDIQKGGVRQFSIRPTSLGGAQLIAETGYIIIQAPQEIIMQPGINVVDMNFAGVFGFQFNFGTAQSQINTKGSNTSLALQLAGTQGIVIEANTNFAIGAIAGSYGGGHGVTFIANDTTDPTTNPVGGGILFVNGGSLKWRNPSGIVTIIAP